MQTGPTNAISEHAPAWHSHTFETIPLVLNTPLTKRTTVRVIEPGLWWEKKDVIIEHIAESLRPLGVGIAMVQACKTGCYFHLGCTVKVEKRTPVATGAQTPELKSDEQVCECSFSIIFKYVNGAWCVHHLHLLHKGHPPTVSLVKPEERLQEKKMTNDEQDAVLGIELIPPRKVTHVELPLLAAGDGLQNPEALLKARLAGLLVTWIKAGPTVRREIDAILKTTLNALQLVVQQLPNHAQGNHRNHAIAGSAFNSVGWDQRCNPARPQKRSCGPTLGLDRAGSQAPVTSTSSPKRCRHLLQGSHDPLQVPTDEIVQSTSPHPTVQRVLDLDQQSHPARSRKLSDEQTAIALVAYLLDKRVQQLAVDPTHLVQGSLEWTLFRCGKVSGPFAHQVRVHASRSGSAVLDIFGLLTAPETEHASRGKPVKAAVVELFAQHKGWAVMPDLAFVQHTALNGLGFSPDARLLDSDGRTVLLELKGSEKTIDVPVCPVRWCDQVRLGMMVLNVHAAYVVHYVTEDEKPVQLKVWSFCDSDPKHKVWLSEFLEGFQHIYFKYLRWYHDMNLNDGIIVMLDLFRNSVPKQQEALQCRALSWLTV